MTLTDSFLRIALGSRIAPVADDVSGDIHLGRDTTTLFPAADITWRARISSNGGSAAIDLIHGTITPNAAPVAQVETATIIAAAGATSSGNLTLTITSNYPTVVLVPLVAGVHTTAALIAAAVRAALAADADIAQHFTAGGTAAEVSLTRHIYLLGDNDGTLNIAIAANLGVSAVVASTATTAGVAGVSVQRLGGDGCDLNGTTLPDLAELEALYLQAADNADAITLSASISLWATLASGRCLLLSGLESIDVLSAHDFILTAAGVGILDIILIGRSVL